MKKKSNSQSAFLTPRFALAAFLCLSGVFMALGAAEFAPARSELAAELPRFSSTSAAGLPADSVAPRHLLRPTAPFTFSNTGSLNTARYLHTATLLPNGKVLVAGGLMAAASVFASAELYDPASGTWTATGSLNTARYDSHGDVAAQRQGARRRGIDNGGSLASAELYDPASGTWTATGSLNTARDLHTATLLPNGKVLVAGGYNAGTLSHERGTVRSGERDLDVPPAASTPHATITRRRCCPTARCWSQAEMITAAIFASAELYDPASGTWTATGSLNTARYRSHGDVAAQRQGAGRRRI